MEKLFSVAHNEGPLWGNSLRRRCMCVGSDDPAGEYPNTRLVLQELCISDVTLDDCRHVQHVCWQVSRRAAHLAATGTRNTTNPSILSELDGQNAAIIIYPQGLI